MEPLGLQPYLFLNLAIKIIASGARITWARGRFNYKTGLQALESHKKRFVARRSR